jgi:16S rRNA (cytosine967-C5)-methyltransferase
MKAANTKKARLTSPHEAPGLAVRAVAADILDGVLRRHRALDEQLEASNRLTALPDRDRALSRALVATVLRRLGTLRQFLSLFLDRGLPAGVPLVETALLLGAAQILFLQIPDHAAVDLSVRLVQADRNAARFAGLVNAVLRRLAREGTHELAKLDPVSLDTPSWLMVRWANTYGEETARAIAAANGSEPALDLTVKSDPDAWAARLGGRVLPTGSVRAIVHGPVTALPGFAEGAWWVQDAAAALPVHLFGDLHGKRVADLCAAPGGKTAQLAAAGALVTAVDRAPARLDRVRGNLKRLLLTAELVCADAATWIPEQKFDAVLLDAPCSSTGTIRRHPDIPWIKQPADITALLGTQGQLIEQALALVKSGGTLIYCTCSLEPEENEFIVAGLLSRNRGVRRVPIMPHDVFGKSEFINETGDLRTLPYQLSDADSRFAGLDGFYAARLEKA